MFRLNNREMNGKPTFVFKMSQTQSRLALAMNRDDNLFLNGEYCFADGTFKRCPGFVTLSAFIYLGLLRKMVKIATMEAESESTENWLIFWNLINQILSAQQQSPTKFNPLAGVLMKPVAYGKHLKKFTVKIQFEKELLAAKNITPGPLKASRIR